MTAAIYYFSGTGNSLHAARTIAAGIGGCRLVNMATLQDAGAIRTEAEVVGLVFPVYYWSTPGIVEDFVRRLELQNSPYVFAVATCGGGPGITLFRLARLLEERGIKLAAGFTLDMPSNAYVGFDLTTPPGEWDGLLNSADERLARIAEAVGRKEIAGIEGRYSMLRAVGSPLMRAGTSKGYRMWRRFRATDQCTGCGTCQRICPMGNVEVAGRTVTWGDRCAECLGCFHWCPKLAIQLDRRSPRIPRYHHPGVTAKDMAMR